MSDDHDLPADLAPEDRPMILADSREQDRLPLRRLPWRVATLYVGDYSVAGLESSFGVERKVALGDLVPSLSGGRDRFFHSLHRLRGCAFRRLLVVGCRAEIKQHRYRSKMTPRAVLAGLAVIESRYGVPVVWSPDPEAAGRLLESWACWQAREVRRAAQRLAGGKAAP